MTAIQCVIYCRVSSEKQGKGYSLDTQLEGCRVWCTRHGYVIAGEFIEQHTGTVMERPALGELLDTLGRGGIDVVVAWDLDRLLGREELPQVLTKHQILDAGARIEYALDGSGHARDTSAADDGELLTGIKALLARQENRKRAEALRRGQRGRAEAGYVLATGGPVPYGYDYISEPHKGRLAINGTEAAVVRDIFHWLVIDGLSCRGIARRLHERAIPTREDTTRQRRKQTDPTVWAPTTVREMFRNPVYKGEYVWGKTRRVKRRAELKPDGTPYKTRHVKVLTDPSEWVTIAVPAIVDEATWERAHARLAENKQFAKPPRQTPLLRGLLFCPDCGCRLVAGISNKHRYYQCPSGKGYPRRHGCKATCRIRADRLEAIVWEYVIDYLLDRDRLELDVERRRAEEAEQRAKHEGRLKALDSELAVIDRRLSELLDAVLDGFPAAVIDTKKQELIEKRERFMAEREALAAVPVTLTPDIAAMLSNVAAQIEQLLPKMTIEDQRSLLRAAQLHLTVLDPETVRVRGIMSEELLYITSECA